MATLWSSKYLAIVYVFVCLVSAARMSENNERSANTSHPQVLHSCNFEEPYICGWSKGQFDVVRGFEWQRTNNNFGDHGLSYDHTFGREHRGYYLKMLYDRTRTGKGRILSPVFPASYKNFCFTFWFHFYGDRGDFERAGCKGLLKIFVKPQSSNYSQLTPYRKINRRWRHNWKKETMEIPDVSESFQIMFEGTGGNEREYCEIRIDDINIQSTTCDSALEMPKLKTQDDSCMGRCRPKGEYHERTCSCYRNCTVAGNCCSDFVSICGVCPPLEDVFKNGRVDLYFNPDLRMAKFFCYAGYYMIGGSMAACEDDRWIAPYVDGQLRDYIPECVPETVRPEEVLSCDFEEPDNCGWRNLNLVADESLKWQKTSSLSEKGPEYDDTIFIDDTFLNENRGFVLYMTPAPNARGTALLLSPVFPAHYKRYCFSYWLRYYGPEKCEWSFNVFVKLQSSDYSSLTPYLEVHRYSDYRDIETMDIPDVNENFQIIMEASAGPQGENCLIAIDDINIHSGNCRLVVRSPTSKIDGNSCRGRCGELKPRRSASCYCSNNCTELGNCCADFSRFCTETEVKSVDISTNPLTDYSTTVPLKSVDPSTDDFSMDYSTTLPLLSTRSSENPARPSEYPARPPEWETYSPDICTCCNHSTSVASRNLADTGYDRYKTVMSQIIGIVETSCAIVETSLGTPK